ncbi:MAG: glycine cleavage system protein GcvH [Saprospiraceae bacterium]|nr:glycine cleavage system protein GcvH [Saprospiraceae bacterium]
MDFPENLKYTKDHEWIRVEDNIAYVGITDFAQNELGDVVYIDIDCEGDTLEQEEVFGSVETTKTASDLFMPISGTITEINSALEDEPELVNSDPYGEGWMLKVEISDVSELDGLMDATAYQSCTSA